MIKVNELKNVINDTSLNLYDLKNRHNLLEKKLEIYLKTKSSCKSGSATEKVVNSIKDEILEANKEASILERSRLELEDEMKVLINPPKQKKYKDRVYLPNDVCNEILRRLANGEQQRSLAVEYDISESTISLWKSGKRRSPILIIAS